MDNDTLVAKLTALKAAAEAVVSGVDDVLAQVGTSEDTAEQSTGNSQEGGASSDSE